jgi:hypothetical protein
MAKRNFLIRLLLFNQARESAKVPFKSFVSWSILIIGLILFSCTPPKPLEVNITSLVACKSWDKEGKPVGVSKIFSPTEKRIYACGHLRTNGPPIALAVYWYYENRLISREVLTDVYDDFHSFIEPSKETFPKGEYRIEIVVGKWVIQSTEFRVE